MSDRAPIPVAVVGVGHLGSRHARVYRGLPQADLVGVADVSPDRAQRVAAEYHSTATTDYRRLLPKIRAASVAVPTVHHCQVVMDLLEAGVDVLVEKPIAATVTEARDMVEAARANGRILAVGHTERYNPAVAAVLDEVVEPRFIEVHRLGVFTPRSLDIDAVLDLMIHDLDVVATLVRSDVRSIEAIGVPVLTERVDIANARLRFDSGCVANLTASRISQTKVRKLRIWERQRYISLDYLNQQAVSYRLVRNDDRGPEIECHDAAVQREEPLKLELVDFLGAVAGRREPKVTRLEGLNALELAARILSVMER